MAAPGARLAAQCYPVYMAETDNLVLEHVRAIRSEIAGLRSETRERLDRVETRLAVIEGTLGNLYALSGSDRETMHSLTRRIERIERRLQLTDQPSS
jgi:hypothetical protein